MKELTYRFDNPHNSCEKVLYCKETKQYYILMPCTPYSERLCTCTPSKGYYEADCPVKAGLTYLIEGKTVTTEENGEIVNHAEKEACENKELEFFRLKPEYVNDPLYDFYSKDTLFRHLYGWMNPTHFDKITVKRKDCFCIMNRWYLKEEE